MYLRHEAGHAFNYAYRLYRTPRVARPVRAVQPPLPRRLPAGAVLAAVRAPHRRLVRAEASRRGLRRDLRGLADAALAVARSATRAGRRIAKLRYVDRIARRLRRRRAGAAARRHRHHGRGDGDHGRGVLQQVLDEQTRPDRARARRRPRDMFSLASAGRRARAPAAELVRENREVLIDKIDLLDRRAAPAGARAWSSRSRARAGARPAGRAVERETGT